MGYRSDVFIGVAVATKEDLGAIMSTYNMLEEVRSEKEIVACLRFVHYDNITHTPDRNTPYIDDPQRAGRREGVMSVGCWVAYYYGSGMKWYDEFSDIIAIETLRAHTEEVCSALGIPYAWRKARAGEEAGDLEDESEQSDDPYRIGDVLVDALQDIAYTQTYSSVDLNTGEGERLGDFFSK